MPDSQEDYIAEIKDGSNWRTVHCKFCNSTILEPAIGKYINFEMEMPTVTQKVKDPNTTKETLNSFWEVQSMFAFTNIGFSNTVEKTKYLTCADCDMGPIGYHDLTTEKSFVALSRVVHK